MEDMRRTTYRKGDQQRSPLTQGPKKIQEEKEMEMASVTRGGNETPAEDDEVEKQLRQQIEQIVRRELAQDRKIKDNQTILS